MNAFAQTRELEKKSPTAPVKGRLMPLRQLDVDDLYLLSTLGEGLRLIDAARRLNLSQPAITQRIHKIEQAININLLDRSVRGTKLTAIGNDVCRSVQVSLSLLERITVPDTMTSFFE